MGVLTPLFYGKILLHYGGFVISEMIGYTQVGNNLSSRVWGWTTWRFGCPHIQIYCLLNMTVIDNLVLTIQKILGIIILEHMFGIVYHERGLKLYDKE